MSKEYLRTYRLYDAEEVSKHLLIVGDLKGDCSACRAIGIEPSTAKHCPECGTEFKYCASRRVDAFPGERFQWASRMSERRPDLILIDYTDFTKVMGRKKARDFFG